MELYDSIGHGYGKRRKQDPRIAEPIVERGERWVSRALALAPDDVGVLHLAACFYGARGDVEKTIHFLERRLKNADAYFAWMDNDPDFDSVRDDPRFIAMVERQQERRRGNQPSA